MGGKQPSRSTSICQKDWRRLERVGRVEPRRRLEAGAASVLRERSRSESLYLSSHWIGGENGMCFDLSVS